MVDSVLRAAGYELPDLDHRTRRIDAVLLHPVAGTVIFLLTMFVFFQTIFTLAAPLQATSGTSSAGWRPGQRPRAPVLAVGVPVRGGDRRVGTVLSFLPQIILLFVPIALLEAPAT